MSKVPKENSRRCLDDHAHNVSLVCASAKRTAFKRAQLVLSGLNSLDGQIIGESDAWSRLRKTVDALSALSVQPVNSPVLSLFHLIEKRLERTKPYRITARCYHSGQSPETVLNTHAFANNELITIYFSSTHDDSLEVFVALDSLMIEYGQVHCRVLRQFVQSPTEHNSFSASISDLPSNSVLEDNILAFDLKPNEILEVVFMWPTLH